MQFFLGTLLLSTTGIIGVRSSDRSCSSDADCWGVLSCESLPEVDAVICMESVGICVCVTGLPTDKRALTGVNDVAREIIVTAEKDVTRETGVSDVTTDGTGVIAGGVIGGIDLRSVLSREVRQGLVCIVEIDCLTITCDLGFVECVFQICVCTVYVTEFVGRRDAPLELDFDDGF